MTAIDVLAIVMLGLTVVLGVGGFATRNRIRRIERELDAYEAAKRAPAE